MSYESLDSAIVQAEAREAREARQARREPPSYHLVSRLGVNVKSLPLAAGALRVKYPGRCVPGKIMALADKFVSYPETLS